MRQDHHRKRVATLLQRLPPLRVVQQFHHRESYPDTQAPTGVAETVRSPAGVVVAQDRQAHHLPIIPVEQSVVVGVHSPGKAGSSGGLHLDVDQDPLLLAAVEPHLDEVVHPSPPQFRLADDLPEFLVQGLAAAAPVDLGMGVGKEQGQKRLEVPLRASFHGLS